MKVSAYIYIHAIFSLSISCIQYNIMYIRFIYVFVVTVSLYVPLLLMI